MKKVLIFNKLKSQTNFQDVSLENLDEPLHPYMGLKWTNVLINSGLKVEYLNKYLNEKYRNINFFIKYFLAPKKFSTIVVYSTNGLGNVALIRLFNWNVNIVFFSLSKINPDGSKLKYILRKILFFLDSILSDHIVVGLNELKQYFASYRNVTYFPFYSDVNYFRDKINNVENDLRFGKKYILIVGDITRDDYFVYNELADLDIPIIRITRDKRVVTLLHELINKDRGDLILSGISFEQLSIFYKYSELCIVASRYDHWQPGGITSIVEALACEGICVCNSGGEIEKEFNYLCTISRLINPLHYFDYPQKNSLKNVVLKLLNSTEIEFKNMKDNSLNFSKQVLDMSTHGIPKLNQLFNNLF